MNNLLRNIPSLTELLESPPLKALVERASRNVVVSRARKYLDELRAQVQSAAANVYIPPPAELAQKIADWLALDGPAGLLPVINATGVVVDDALGRAPLAEEAIEALAVVGRSYVNLELNLASGEAASRGAAVDLLLANLTGAEAALVVNNGTGALLAALAALASGREVIVSRGQVGELGNGCRLGDIVSASGAVLREVGSTNRTRGEDYAAAFSPQTAAVLRVRRMDYEIVGSAEEAPLAELAALARRHSLPLIDDGGSGALIDFAPYGLQGHVLVADSVRAGADLVLFSGDKLLGGPQCGILLGRRDLIRKIEEHPLSRALRIDKVRLSALAATLRLLKDSELAERSVPVVSLLATPIENLRQRAERIAPQIEATGVVRASVVESQASVLGSRLASQMMPTMAVSLEPLTGTVEQLAARLRGGAIPVLGRVEGARLLLDLRGVPPRDDLALVEACEALRPAGERASAANDAEGGMPPDVT
jgi:L-seryl-tRNA(Ser) seleniumtransferase